jgi:hypothetical protein
MSVLSNAVTSVCVLIKVKGKGYPITGHQGPRGARRGWVVRTTPWPLYPWERPGTHCTGGWVGPRAGLDGCEKSRPTGIFFYCLRLFRVMYFVLVFDEGLRVVDFSIMKNPTASVGSEFDPRTVQPVVSRYTHWATRPLCVNYEPKKHHNASRRSGGRYNFPGHVISNNTQWKTKISYRAAHQFRQCDFLSCNISSRDINISFEPFQAHTEYTIIPSEK